jgi:hypothetical protein
MPFAISSLALIQKNDPFEIDETSIPMHAWSGQESDPLSDLEGDIRRLLRERAEAGFAVDEARKQNEERRAANFYWRCSIFWMLSTASFAIFTKKRTRLPSR